MKRFVLPVLLFLPALIFSQSNSTKPGNKFVLVIHGGAGALLKKDMTPEKEKAYHAALEEALKIGYDTLAKGGAALDAVEMVVRYMEDCPLFNAGKGAVFTSEGKNELDAAIMNGKNLAAGSVAGVTVIKNPISTARAVMEKSEHVMLIGKGAEKFAEQNGQALVDPSYFFTEHRWKALQDAKKEDSLKVKKETPNHLAIKQTTNKDYKYGTVGAAALDRYGNLAAATSTGGMTNKKYGRVGDAPIIGAGTYANNKTCAISCTGWGEFFIRLGMAKTISDMMEFGNWSLTDASHEMVMKRLPALGGDGGLIAVDKNGNIALPFCTEGMYRGYVKEDGKKVVRIYKEGE